MVFRPFFKKKAHLSGGLTMLISFRPALYLPSPDKVTIAVRCCPTLFELRKVPRELSEGRSIHV